MNKTSSPPVIEFSEGKELDPKAKEAATKIMERIIQDHSITKTAIATIMEEVYGDSWSRYRNSLNDDVRQKVGLALVNIDRNGFDAEMLRVKSDIIILLMGTESLNES